MIPSQLFCKPAFYAHLLSGLFLLASMVVLVQRKDLKYVALFALLSIAFALHGQSHMEMEKRYPFDPLCQWLSS